MSLFSFYQLFCSNHFAMSVFIFQVFILQYCINNRETWHSNSQFSCLLIIQNFCHSLNQNSKIHSAHGGGLHDHPSQRLMIKCLTIIQIELEFGNVGFWGEGKTRVPAKKPLRAENRTNNKLNPHTMPGLEIKPRTLWWEASTLTTAPTLLP